MKKQRILFEKDEPLSPEVEDQIIELLGSEGAKKIDFGFMK